MSSLSILRYEIKYVFMTTLHDIKYIRQSPHYSAIEYDSKLLQEKLREIITMEFLARGS